MENQSSHSENAKRVLFVNFLKKKSKMLPVPLCSPIMFWVWTFVNILMVFGHYKKFVRKVRVKMLLRDLKINKIVCGFMMKIIIMFQKYFKSCKVLKGFNLIGFSTKDYNSWIFIIIFFLSKKFEFLCFLCFKDCNSLFFINSSFL